MRQQKKNVVDIEAAAAQAKLKRVEACMREVNDVLAKYRCDVRPEVRIADQWVPVSMLLNLPNQIAIVSK